MVDPQAMGLAAAAKSEAERVLLVVKALLDDLVKRELITEEKRSAWLALAAPGGNSPGQTKT